MRYYIADLHFDHESLNHRMDNRGFATVEAMNEYMIAQWNGKVRAGDEVVILGDFCISPAGQDVNKLLKRLNGTKYLITGNHDKYLDSRLFDRSLFGWIEPYKELHDNKRKVVLCHYPIMCYNGQYNIHDDGRPKTYMLYGHVHNTYDQQLINEFQEITRNRKRMVFGKDEEMNIPCNMINCFCMFSDYVPLSLDEWIELWGQVPWGQVPQCQVPSYPSPKETKES